MFEENIKEIRGLSVSSWQGLLGSNFFNFDPIFKILFAYEHKLVLVSGAGI